MAQMVIFCVDDKQPFIFPVSTMVTDDLGI